MANKVVWIVCAIAVSLVMTQGCVPLRDPTVSAPDGSSGLQVTAVAEPADVFEGGTVALRASASGGTPPYRFLWDQNGGPADAALEGSNTPLLTAGPLDAVGTYVFRVVVADAADEHADAFVEVRTLAAVNTTVPTLALIGEPEVLSVGLVDPTAEATFQWTVLQGDAVIADPARASTTLTTNVSETVRIRLTVTIASGSTSSTATREFDVVSIADHQPRVRIETTEGDFTIELDVEAAPLHTTNFLLYVDAGFYDGLLIHRVACSGGTTEDECIPFVIQTGGYRRVDGELEEVEATREAVPSEADNGLSNGELYSVALALRGGDPDSGTTQFFINLNEDNSRLDAQGFTVFGHVVLGQEVVDQIARVETVANPVLPGETSLPAEDIIMQRVARESSGG